MPGHNSLNRALEELTIGVHRSVKHNEDQEAQLGGGTFMQYMTCDVDGLVGGGLLAIDVPVDWDLPFLMRVDPRNANGRSSPHFASGIEILTDSYINLSVQVRSWLENEQGWLMGANLRVLAHAPGALRAHSFRAVLHLTFTGYAAPSEDTL